MILTYHIPRVSKFIDPGVVHLENKFLVLVFRRENNSILKIYLVDVFLVKEYEKYNIVPETAQSIHSWHFNNKRKDIINEGIQS